VVRSVVVAGIRRQGSTTGLRAPHYPFTDQEICTPLLHSYIAPPVQINPDAQCSPSGMRTRLTLEYAILRPPVDPALSMSQAAEGVKWAVIAMLP